jgi:hypothetical protein
MKDGPGVVLAVVVHHEDVEQDALLREEGVETGLEMLAAVPVDYDGGDPWGVLRIQRVNSWSSGEFPVSLFVVSKMR